jgi:RHS repeat-associated protein
MTNDSFNTYTYDAEGNILTVDGCGNGNYVYDAMNRRVRIQTSATTTDSIYDYAGRRISSWLNPTAGYVGTPYEGRIYWDGKQIAFRAIDGITYFEHQDWTGTERARTDNTGAVASTYSSLPWGDASSATLGGVGANEDNAIFAGLDLDTNAAGAAISDHAQFRNYSFYQGRWLAPDPYSGSYDLTNPQSFNRYAYVLNNPLSFTDPLGLEDVDCGADDTVCVDGGDPGGGGGGGGDPGGGGGGGGGGEGPPDCSGNFTVCVAGNPPSGPATTPSGVTSNISCYDLAAGNVPSSGLSTWWNGYTNASSMFSNWLAGTGPSDTTFGPTSAPSQQMLSAYGLSQNVSAFLAGGPSSNFQNFGAQGFLSSGLNPTAQFVGSYGWSMNQSGGYLNITITNATTPFSFFYHAPGLNPNPPTRINSVFNPGWHPMGRVNQVFHIRVPC